MQIASRTQRLVRWRTQASSMTRSEKVIWLFFAATSCQLAFLHPYVTLLPGTRTNLFSGLLCLLTLAVAWIFSQAGGIKVKSPEFLVSVALVGIGVVSAVSSLTPLPSSCRVAVLLASGLGGFWCARIFLQTPENQRRFQWLCLFLLSGVLLLSLAGYLLGGTIEYYFFDGSNHPLVNLIFLLSFAPLTLLGQKSRPLRLLGVVLLGLGYVVLCLSQRLSVVFIPIGLGLVGMLFGAWRWKHALAALLVVGLVIGLFSHQILWFKLNKQYPSYRLENISFSWSIIRQHPLLGIGLRTPRERFLQDYQIRYPYDTKEEFVRNVREIVTPDNQILSFLVGLGFPFTIIYCLAVLLLLVRLVGMAFRPPPGHYFPPLVLLVPISLALVHWQVYDGLLFAQNSWFFHILLGLIPMGSAVPAVVETGTNLSFPPATPYQERRQG